MERTWSATAAHAIPLPDAFDGHIPARAGRQIEIATHSQLGYGLGVTTLPKIRRIGTRLRTLPQAADGAPLRPRRWSSAMLLAGASVVEIDHAGQTYRLRQTSNGRLILTK